VDSSPPLVSVVLLNYNGKRLVKLWWPILNLEYPNYEVIFFDNGSTDGSQEDFRRLASSRPCLATRILGVGQNVGYSKANNIAVQHASGKYVVLLSNDVEVTPCWLTNMIRFMESRPDVGVAQSVMYQLQNHSKHDVSGNYIDVFGFNHRLRPPSRPVEVFYSEGAVMFIRTTVLRDVRWLFDDDYFMFYEDVDFCWRAQLRGQRIFVVPDSYVYHQRGGTVPGVVMRLDPKYVRTNTRNRLATLFKNYGAANVLKYLPVSIALEILKGCWLCVNRKSLAGFACFRGVVDFLFALPHLIPRRRTVQTRRVVSERVILRRIFGPSQAFRELTAYAGQLKVNMVRPVTKT